MVFDVGVGVYLEILFYTKICIISLTILSILTRIYNSIAGNENNPDSFQSKLDSANYYLVLFIVLLSSFVIVYKYSSQYSIIVNEIHSKFKQLIGKRTVITGFGPDSNSIIESLTFWMLIYFIILTISILVSKSTNNINYSTYLL